MTCFRGFSNFHCSSHILDDLKPYMSASEMEMAEQMGSMMNMLEMVQCMQTMSDNTYDDPKSKGAAVNPMDILKNIMTPEQQDMFNMYSNMFDQEISRPQTDSKKGESDNE